MITNPWFHQQLALERQRTALARAEQRRLAKRGRSSRASAGSVRPRGRGAALRPGACAESAC
jgi:hypothetical protein